MNRATICVMMAVVFFFVGPPLACTVWLHPLGIIWVEFVTPDPILLGKSGTWTELFAKYVIAATLCLHIYKFRQLSEFTLASSHYDVVTYLRIGYTQWTFWPDMQYIALRFLNYFHRMLANIFHFVCPITIVSEWASNGGIPPLLYNGGQSEEALILLLGFMHCWMTTIFIESAQKIIYEFHGYVPPSILQNRERNSFFIISSGLYFFAYGLVFALTGNLTPLTSPRESYLPIVFTSMYVGYMLSEASRYVEYTFLRRLVDIYKDRAEKQKVETGKRRGKGKSRQRSDDTTMLDDVFNERAMFYDTSQTGLGVGPGSVRLLLGSCCLGSSF